MKASNETRPNPACFGHGSENVPGCQCLKVFTAYKERKKDWVPTPDEKRDFRS